MNRAPGKTDIGLRQVGVPTGNACVGFAFASRELPAGFAAEAAALSSAQGWRRDALPAAAWALVLDGLLGAPELTFQEIREGGQRWQAPVPAPTEGMTAHAWIEAVDRAREAATPVPAGGESDEAWLCGPLPPDASHAAFAIGFDLGTAAGLAARYEPGGFEAGQADTLLDCTVRAAQGLAGDPSGPLSRIDLLGEEQRGRLAAWNPAAQECDPRASVASEFARQVADRGDRPAVVTDERSMPYAELDRRSTALAHRLLAAGACRGRVVGVALERSPEALVALLGILKAGAAYLPLDLRYPAERIAYMLRDARAGQVIARAADAARFPAGTQVLEAEGACADDALVPPLPVDGAPESHDIAYVMYTSGSTGLPKGIEIPHGAILRLVSGTQYVRFDTGSVVLQAAPLGFDASTFEIWGPLLNGGRCVLHPEAVPTGPGLARSIRRHGVRTAWLTAALFNGLVDREPRDLDGLEELLTGGEALSVPHVCRALDALPGIRILNGYGPTECTTFTATYRIPREFDRARRSIPIGRPIDGTTVHVLNARLEPLPIGLAGELCVGGPGLARGYLGQPALDGERFVASALGGAQGRLYRTGDRARFLPDGNLEFLGRQDGQVKIRGYRIEPGEIEAALASHPGVKSCAVIAREDSPGGARLVAYVVPREAPLAAAALREHLAARLPDFMIPGAYVSLTALPVTVNGKLDRRALPAPEARRPELRQPYQSPEGDIEGTLCRLFAQVLGIDRAGRLDNFFELGGNSLLVMAALARLQQETGRTLPAARFFDDPTPASLAKALEAGPADDIAPRRLARTDRQPGAREPVAIVAMSGRFPGAASVEAFWDNLREGRESITRFAPADLDASIPASLRGDPAYVSARGVLEGVEDFDAAFFGIAPLEARLMDPQQRLFLELAWECLERAGYPPDACPVPVGVFGGMYNATYFQRHVSAHPQEAAKLGEFQTMLGNEKDYVATRTANRLNLTGPAVSVHTACSTSLVAIVQAVTSLRAGQCDMALAGGASVTCPPRSGYLYQEGAMLSPDGHTRSFDADAQGTVFSDGAAVVLLKRLSDALADGDPIHAVILGAAVNNDGGLKASFTAPSVDGQAAVIAAALADAGVEARSISYVETHGTATPLGDPVEVEALAKAFRRQTADTAFCRIGSVKSNVGHLVIAAGAAGVIKTACALARELLPATLHFRAPNPKLALEGSPFVVNDRATPWPRAGTPRRAGVSAFGVGGTNAHVILEEAPLPSPAAVESGPRLLLLSARTESALAAATAQLADCLAGPTPPALADAAHTLRVGRKAFGARACFVAGTAAEAAEVMRTADSPWRATGSVAASAPPVALLFPGQGAQYAAMGSRLHAANEVFRAAFDECLAALDGVAGPDLRERLFSGDARALVETSLTQPALFCLEYALARHWLSRGLRPAALIGHSVGEFVAATIAGVFRPADAARLVARRGALMQALPPGAMLAVRAPLASVQPRLSGSLCLAAENSPGLCVVAGSTADIDALQAALERESIGSRRLQTSHAFHSSMMDAAVAPFEREVREVELSAPAIPIYSTVTGRLLLEAEARDPGYWARHLREPVRFSPALAALMAASPGVLLEAGPRATLSTLARQHAARGQPAPLAFSSLGDAPGSEERSLLLAAGRLWTLGVPVDLAPPAREALRRRVVLPTYPFERRRFWLEAAPAGAEAAPALPVSAPAQAARPADPPKAEPAMSPSSPATAAAPGRVADLTARLRTLLEDISGLEMAGADPAAPLVELGMDSLTLTQAAIQIKQTFKVAVTFRQLMESYRSLDSLAAFLDTQMPASAPPAIAVAAAPAPLPAAPAFPAMPAMPAAAGTLVEQVIRQQMQLMAQQIALLQGSAGFAPAAPAAVAPAPAIAPTPAQAPAPAEAAPAQAEAAGPQTYDVKKAFGAIARIHTEATELTERQRARLDAFMRRYIARTKLSKEYTVTHRPHMADPRVVNGFRPMIKEIVYQLVIGRSKGAYVWDLDGNQYVDVLSGFGMNLFGWQPDFVNEAVRAQLDLGYEIGPQHPLAGEVAKLVCELTGHDRAGLCNTGSEAVMGAVRIARTVTGRGTVALFTGSYHGIFDEVIVRATRKLRAVPAAPGIMPSTAQNVLVLDYGTPESMRILREHADDLAAVLVEPVQSRRPDFQPREFLHELREFTAQTGSLLIFDEVVTGFRSHPGGIQALFDIRADLCTYGKVIGGGFPIGVIAGRREYMDALDGGAWQYGDDSIPTVGVTYFAGTFVRHPLALAAAKAVLGHLKQEGPALQASLTRRTTAMVEELNEFCRSVGAPIVLKSFASVWKTFFTEDHPLQDLLFAMMRSRGIHILDNFPCFMTTALTEADIAAVKAAFRESVVELQEAEFIPRRAQASAFDAAKPPVPGARLGKDQEGRPAWFVPHPDRPGKYLKIDA